MPTMSLDNAWVLQPATAAEKISGGSLVIKRYTGTLGTGTVDITTDFTVIIGVLGLNYTSQAAGPADSLTWAATVVNGAAVLTVKGYGTATPTFEAWVVGIQGAQV